MKRLALIVMTAVVASVALAETAQEKAEIDYIAAKNSRERNQPAVAFKKLLPVREVLGPLPELSSYLARAAFAAGDKEAARKYMKEAFDARDAAFTKTPDYQTLVDLELAGIPGAGSDTHSVAGSEGALATVWPCSGRTFLPRAGTGMVSVVEEKGSSGEWYESYVIVEKYLKVSRIDDLHWELDTESSFDGKVSHPELRRVDCDTAEVALRVGDKRATKVYNPRCRMTLVEKVVGTEDMPLLSGGSALGALKIVQTPTEKVGCDMESKTTTIWWTPGRGEIQRMYSPNLRGEPHELRSRQDVFQSAARASAFAESKRSQIARDNWSWLLEHLPQTAWRCPYGGGRAPVGGIATAG